MNTFCIQHIEQDGTHLIFKSIPSLTITPQLLIKIIERFFSSSTAPTESSSIETNINIGIDNQRWTSIKTFGAGSEFYGVVFSKKKFNEADRLFEELNIELEPFWLARDHPSVAFTIYNKQLAVRRDKAIFGQVDGTTAPLYRYGSPERAVVHPWTPTLLKIRDIIEQRTGVRCNHIVVNRYVDGKDTIGYHMDKDGDFTDDYSIITVSFGDPRELAIRPTELKSGKPTDSIVTPHGSAYRINKATNTRFKHSILEQKKGAVGMRLGLTFRTIATMYNSTTHQVIEAKKWGSNDKKRKSNVDDEHKDSSAKRVNQST